MRPFAAATAGVVVVLALAACGTSDSDVAKSFAKQGVAKVEAQGFAATKALTSVHVAGHAGSATDTLAIDLSLDRDHNCVGSVTVNGNRMDVRRVRGTLFLKASLATWAKTTTTKDTSQLRPLLGKWVTGLPSADVTVYETLCDVTHLLSSYPTHAGTDDRVTGTAVAGGHPLVTVSGHFGGSAEVITMNVLATEPHYITHLSGGGTDLTLTRFEKAVSVAQPSTADVVDLSKTG